MFGFTQSLCEEMHWDSLDDFGQAEGILILHFDQDKRQSCVLLGIRSKYSDARSHFDNIKIISARMFVVCL